MEFVARPSARLWMPDLAVQDGEELMKGEQRCGLQVGDPLKPTLPKISWDFVRTSRTPRRGVQRFASGAAELQN